MTEPVAWRKRTSGDKKWRYEETGYIGDWDEIERLYTSEQLHPRVKMTPAEFDELEISLINAQFDYSSLKKTIEIVPDMKWFVRSKESDINGYGWLSIIDKYQTPVYQYNNDKPLSSFVSFDTKEEAERWISPLTEAVHLPVKGE